MNRPTIPPRLVPSPPPPEKIKIDKNPPDSKGDVDGLDQLGQQSSNNGVDDNADLYAQASRGNVGKPRMDSTCTDEFLENLGISSYRHGYPLGDEFLGNKKGSTREEIEGGGAVEDDP